MKILLDTHIIIWGLTNDPRLSDEARAIITDPDNIIYYSSASVWEIAVKSQKAPDKCPFNEIEIANLCDLSGFQLMDISIKHITSMRSLSIKAGHELSNYDPFDRILLSQAKSENMKLLSHDNNFKNYDENCIYTV